MTVFLSFRNKRPNRGGLGKRPNVSKFVCATLPYPANLFLVVPVRRRFCIIVKPVRAPATDKASHHEAKHISTASKGHLVTIIIMCRWWWWLWWWGQIRWTFMLLLIGQDEVFDKHSAEPDRNSRSQTFLWELVSSFPARPWESIFYFLFSSQNMKLKERNSCSCLKSWNRLLVGHWHSDLSSFAALTLCTKSVLSQTRPNFVTVVSSNSKLG